MTSLPDRRVLSRAGSGRPRVVPLTAALLLHGAAAAVALTYAAPAPLPVPEPVIVAWVTMETPEPADAVSSAAPSPEPMSSEAPPPDPVSPEAVAEPVSAPEPVPEPVEVALPDRVDLAAVAPASEPLPVAIEPAPVPAPPLPSPPPPRPAFKTPVERPRPAAPPVDPAPAPTVTAIEPSDRSVSVAVVPAAPPRAAAPKVDADYVSRLLGWLERHKEYPRAARLRRVEGTAVLRLLILADGQIAAVQVATSSGHAVLDASSLDMIRRAAPVPRPDGGPVELMIPIVFALGG